MNIMDDRAKLAKVIETLLGGQERVVEVVETLLKRMQEGPVDRQVHPLVNARLEYMAEQLAELRRQTDLLRTECRECKKVMHNKINCTDSTLALEKEQIAGLMHAMELGDLRVEHKVAEHADMLISKRVFTETDDLKKRVSLLEQFSGKINREVGVAVAKWSVVALIVVTILNVLLTHLLSKGG